MKGIFPKRILFWVLGIHLVYFLAACYFKGIYLIDSYGYIMQADNMMANGSWYAEDWNATLLIDYFSIRPPLYAWIILGLRAVWNNIFLVLIVQNILSVWNCLFVYKMVSKQTELTPSIERIFIAGLLFYPAQFFHVNFVMTELLLQTFMLLLVINVGQFLRKPEWRSALVATSLLSLMLLTKPVTLFLPILMFGLMVWAVYTHHRKWILLGSFLLPAVVFHSICKQNEHATGYYHYSSIKSVNQLKYNARYTLINAKGEQYADSVITFHMTQANSLENYGDRLQYMDRQALIILKKYPFAFAKLYTKGVIAFFMDPGRFDAYHFFNIDEQNAPGLMLEINTKGLTAIGQYLQRAPVLILIVLFISFCWNIIIVIGAFSFILNGKLSLSLRVLVLTCVFYIAAATGPVGVSRYRVPVYPILLMGVMCTPPRIALLKLT